MQTGAVHEAALDLAFAVYNGLVLAGLASLFSIGSLLAFTLGFRKMRGGRSFFRCPCRG